MRKLVFALFDLEGYMEALSEYFGTKNFLIECRLFTQKDSLAGFLKEHTVDVLLLGQEVKISELSYLENVRNIIVLSEGSTVCEESETDYPLLFKYQSAENILTEIFQAVGMGEEEAGEGLTEKDRTQFTGIYRPYGQLPPREGFLRGKEGEKTLWLDLELLSGASGTGAAGKREAMRGMSELIFYLKQRNVKLAWKLQPLIQERGGIDYIGPVEDYRDLYSLNREDIDLLLTVLAKETGYEQVIFDVGYLSDSALYLLYCCNRVYMPQAQTSWEENQKNSLEYLLTREGLGEMAESIRYVPTDAQETDG